MMHRATAVVLLMLGCGPEVPAGGETDTTSGTAMGTSTAEPVPTATTDTPVTGDMSDTAGPDVSSTGAGGDGLAEHGPCPNGDECALCVQAEGASICGPECGEYGPGWAPYRCPESAVQKQSVCPLDDDTPGVCLLLCETAADCPDPGMVCVTCPAPYEGACNGLWVFGSAGPNLCAWPTT